MLKPDFVAPVPFPTTLRSQAFTGTSAAAPQAAALAAVLWSRHLNWTAEEVHATLIKSARDVGPPGPDCETGYGMIKLPETP
jgi:subtilisin family serine protease